MSTKKGTNKNDQLSGSNGEDVLYGLAGNDTLDGGKGDDDLIGGDGNDNIIGRFDGSDAIDGGKGTDTLDYSRFSSTISVSVNGDTGDGTTYKNGQVDVFEGIEIFKLSKADDTFFNGLNSHVTTVFGGKGDDSINAVGSVVRGDAGADILYGYDGSADTFWLQRGMGADTVEYFRNEQDTILLDGSEFDLGAKVGNHEYIIRNGNHDAIGTNAQLIFDYGTKQLYYDEDGQGAKAAEIIATFTNGETPIVFNFEII